MQHGDQGRVDQRSEYGAEDLSGKGRGIAQGLRRIYLGLISHDHRHPLTCAHMYMRPFHHFMWPVHMSANVTAGLRCPPEMLQKA